MPFLNAKRLTLNAKRGFTLIELMVVVSIIGILVGSASIFFNNARDKARDSKRKQDLVAIKQALTSYYQDNDYYPQCSGSDNECDSTEGDSWIQGLVEGGYLNKLPKDPKQISENIFVQLAQIFKLVPAEYNFEVFADTSPSYTPMVGSDDGNVTKANTSTSDPYPPIAPTTFDTTSITPDVARSNVTCCGGYKIANGLIRFDTSGLPDDAVITGANLILNVSTKNNADSRNLTAEWYSASNWPIDAADYSETAQSTAGSWSLNSITASGTDNTLALTGPDSTNINRTGYTGLRLHISGGLPLTSQNRIRFSTYELGSAKPRLIITYTVPVAAQCNDTLDNDADTKIDFPSDLGCSSAADTSESPDPAVQCNDTVDNDGDTKIDYPTDPGCSSAADTTESPDPPPPPAAEIEGNYGYVITSFDSQSRPLAYVLWTQLENTNDPEINTKTTALCRDATPNGTTYNYCVKPAD